MVAPVAPVAVSPSAPPLVRPPTAPAPVAVAVVMRAAAVVRRRALQPTAQRIEMLHPLFVRYEGTG